MALALTCPVPSFAAPADTLYLHGTVLTVDEAHPTAQAVAVRGGVIVAVGSDRQVQRLKGANTRVVNLAGKTLIPGFVDGHSHIGDLMGLWTLPDLSPPPVGTTGSIAGLQQALRTFMAAHPAPADQLVVGRGYDDSLLAERRRPNLAELDVIAPGRAICAVHVSGHLAVCNSAGLARIGITRDTPDPPGGRIGRDASGALDGGLQEQAVGRVLAAMTPLSLEQAGRNFDEIQTFYASQGYTTAQDGQTSNPVTVETLLAAQKAGSLRIDIAAYPRWTVVDDLVARRAVVIGGPYVNRLKFAGVKITEDGSPQGKTAFLTQPYVHPPVGEAADYRGYPNLPAAELDAAIDRFLGRGWQVQTHCNGDACIDLVLAAIRKAYAAHPGAEKTRPVIVHSQVTRPDQLEAYKALGVFPTFFAEHTYYWGDWHRDETLGSARAAFISPTGAALQQGVKFSLHTDAPVVPPSAMHAWWSAVNRVTRSGTVLGPDQRLTPAQALKALTLWPAWQHFDEATKGSIEVGKTADLVILGANPLAIDPMTIKDVPVLVTIKADQVIFQRGVTPVARVPFAGR